MPHLLVLCPLLRRRRRRCMVLFTCRLQSSDCLHKRPVSPVEQAVGIAVLFTAFLTPCVYIPPRLSQYRRG